MYPDRCPACDADLRGEPIAEESRDFYGATHYSRCIGIVSREKDRLVAWRCPDCGHRWPEGRRDG